MPVSWPDAHTLTERWGCGLDMHVCGSTSTFGKHQPSSLRGGAACTRADQFPYTILFSIPVASLNSASAHL